MSERSYHGATSRSLSEISLRTTEWEINDSTHWAYSWTNVVRMCKTQVLEIIINHLMKSLARLAKASPLLLMRSMEASLECSAGLLRARHVSTHVIICIRCAARGSCEIFTSAFVAGWSGISSYNTWKQLQYTASTTTHSIN